MHPIDQWQQKVLKREINCAELTDRHRAGNVRADILARCPMRKAAAQIPVNGCPNALLESVGLGPPKQVADLAGIDLEIVDESVNLLILANRAASNFQ